MTELMFGDNPPVEARITGVAQRAGEFSTGANRGIAGTLGAPVDLINIGLNAIGVGGDEPIGGSASINRLFRAAGIPESEAKDRTGEIIMGAGKLVGSNIIPAGGALALASSGSKLGSKILPKLTRDLIKPEQRVTGPRDDLYRKLEAERLHAREELPEPASEGGQPRRPSKRELAAQAAELPKGVAPGEGILNTFDTALTRGMGTEKLAYRVGDLAETLKIRKTTGLDVPNARHVITEDGIRHAWNRHGPDGEEFSGNQIALTREDFSRIPEVTRPENIAEVSKTPQGLDAIIYKIRFNGEIVVVEEVRTGNKELAFATMYKVKAGGG